MSMLAIRPLTFADLEAADRVLASAFGSSSRQVELERFMRLDPDLWLAGEADGQLAAMVGAVNYGPFAYIGLMGVHTNCQRRGYGRLMMQAIIARLAEAGQSCTLLDASDAGAPLYAQLGYEDLGPAHLFQLQERLDFPTPAVQVEPLQPEHLDLVLALDRPYFGAERRKVLGSYLEACPGRAFVAWEQAAPGSLPRLDGYLIAQPRRIGPWVAGDPETAAALLAAALELEYKDRPLVIVPSPNPTGAALVQAAGFSRLRSLRHMRLGQPAPARRLEGIFGQSSFMLG